MAIGRVIRMVKKLINGNLYGKRKFLSAWGVWLIMAAIFTTISILMIIHGEKFRVVVDTLKLFKDYSIWHWGLYFAANAGSKVFNRKNGESK